LYSSCPSARSISSGAAGSAVLSTFAPVSVTNPLREDHDILDGNPDVLLRNVDGSSLSFAPGSTSTPSGIAFRILARRAANSGDTATPGCRQSAKRQRKTRQTQQSSSISG